MSRLIRENQRIATNKKSIFQNSSNYFENSDRMPTKTAHQLVPASPDSQASAGGSQCTLDLPSIDTPIAINIANANRDQNKPIAVMNANSNLKKQQLGEKGPPSNPLNPGVQP